MDFTCCYSRGVFLLPLIILIPFRIFAELNDQPQSNNEIPEVDDDDIPLQFLREKLTNAASVPQPSGSAETTIRKPKNMGYNKSSTRIGMNFTRRAKVADNVEKNRSERRLSAKVKEELKNFPAGKKYDGAFIVKMLECLFTKEELGGSSYGGGISNFNKIRHPALDERRLAIVKGKLLLQSLYLKTKIIYNPVLP